jgi:hypothetical protein
VTCLFQNSEPTDDDSDFVVALAIDEDELKETTSWMTLYNEPESRLLELWKKTAQDRLTFIHPLRKADKPSLNSVIEKWPSLSDPRGQLLVI